MGDARGDDFSLAPEDLHKSVNHHGATTRSIPALVLQFSSELRMEIGDVVPHLVDHGAQYQGVFVGPQFTQALQALSRPRCTSVPPSQG